MSIEELPPHLRRVAILRNVYDQYVHIMNMIHSTQREKEEATKNAAECLSMINDLVILNQEKAETDKPEIPKGETYFTVTVRTDDDGVTLANTLNAYESNDCYLMTIVSNGNKAVLVYKSKK